MLIIGILLGSVLGIILSLVPGFDLGFVFLIVTSSSSNNPQFGIGLILGIEATECIMNHLNMLSSNDSKDKDEKDSLLYTSLLNSIAGKFFGCFVGICLIIFLQNNDLKLEGFTKGLPIVINIGIWIIFITEKSKNKKLATITLISAGLLTFLSSNLEIKESIFTLLSCLFADRLLKSIKENTKKITLSTPTIINYHTGIEILSGFFNGALAAFLWGLPTSVLSAVTKEDNDKPHKTVGKKSFAKSVRSALGLTLILTITSSKGMLGHSISGFHTSFNQVEAIGILGVSFSLSLIGYLLFDRILPVYISIYNFIPNNLINKTITIGTIITIFIMSHGWCIPMGLAGLMLTKLNKAADAPRELSLSALAIIPIINLV